MAQDGKKKWDGDGVPLADSNCFAIGSDDDKNARKAAADTEPEWAKCGQKEGVEVWRVVNFKVKPWPEQKYGEFHSGDSYIVLSTQKVEDKLVHAIFFWLGAETSIDERGTAAYKTVELDDFFLGEPTQHREVQGKESKQFRRLFPHLVYLKGGAESGFRKSATSGLFETRLLQVRRDHLGGVKIFHKELSCDSLNHGDCFVLDAGTTIYTWFGDESNAFEKAKANFEAERLEGQRGGHAKATNEIDEKFWELLGGEGRIKGAAEVETPALAEGEAVDKEPILYDISDDSGKLTMTEIGRGSLSTSMLNSTDVMMVDTHSEVFLWVGKQASRCEGKSCMRLAMTFLAENDRPNETPIHMFKEDSTVVNKDWNKIFGK